jgi:hypothetical protein
MVNVRWRHQLIKIAAWNWKLPHSGALCWLFFKKKSIFTYNEFKKIDVGLFSSIYGLRCGALYKLGAETPSLAEIENQKKLKFN